MIFGVSGTMDRLSREPPVLTARDTVRGPHFFDTDISLSKNTKLTEQAGLQFRAEFFKIFNHTNLALPSNTLFVGGGARNGTSGQITTMVATPRPIQFALRLIFGRESRWQKEKRKIGTSACRLEDVIVLKCYFQITAQMRMLVAIEPVDGRKYAPSTDMWSWAVPPVLAAVRKGPGRHGQAVSVKTLAVFVAPTNGHITWMAPQ